MTDRPPRVSVVLPAYFSDATVAACLDGLRRQTYRDFETIVVNSSPEERTGALVTSRYPEVRFIQSPVRLLPHAARNRGVEVARGTLLVFSDPDCVPRPDWLARLVETHEAGHAVVGGSMELAEGAWFERGVHLCKFHWALRGLPAAPHWILPTANVLYPRAAWEVVGRFDGERFAGDALQSWRARASGYETWFEPRASVAHRHGGTWRSVWRERRTRGREFAETRMAFEGWSRRRAALYAALMPALVVGVTLRAGRDALRSGWGVPFVATLPLQVAGHLAWSLGELGAHLARLAPSPAVEARP